MRELNARGQIENRSFLSLIKTEVIKPLIPAVLSGYLMPRFDLKMLRQASVLRSDFLMRQLGADGKENYLLSNSVGVDLPNHRKNQLKDINIIRHARTGSRFVGYEKATMSMPFLDKRIIEFCLALPADMKVRNGYQRYMIRAGMNGILPDAIRYRITKEPFSPDYHDRYNRQRQKAQAIINDTPKTPLIKEIVDLDKLEKMILYTMRTNRVNTPDEFAAMHNVPQGVYLLAFLSTFA
jgi:asparagine synthase (glutamine-hydrolysing)